MHVKLTKAATLLATGLVGAAAATSSIWSVGCGGDDTLASSPSTDGSTEQDASIEQDVAIPDGTVEDQHVGVDANLDAGETSADSGTESADAGTDADAAAQIVVPADPTGFPHAVDDAYCRQLQVCCGTAANMWRQTGPQGCATYLDSVGAVFGIGQYNDALDSGLVAYDRDAAAGCLTGLANLNCGTVLSGAYQALEGLCLSVLQGTLAPDAGSCLNSLECKPGEFCSAGTGDAGGVCLALRTVGEHCADTANSTDCSYLGNGESGLYCAVTVDAGTVCANTLAVDAGSCVSPSQCQSSLCQSPSCVSSYVFSDPGVKNGFCDTFTIVLPDAGPDGSVDAGDGG